MSGPQTVEYRQWIPRPLEEVFPFFSDEKNLERITPPWLHFQVEGKSTPTLGEGTHIRYKLKVHGIPLHWESKIESWEMNRRFVDTQVKGPYALWHHTHTFEPMGEGTLMTDTIRYQVPGGRLGELLGSSYIAHDVEKIFQYRNQVIAKLFAPKE